jgi:heme-degrading monooxygenase HmoA
MAYAFDRNIMTRKNLLIALISVVNIGCVFFGIIYAGSTFPSIAVNGNTELARQSVLTNPRLTQDDSRVAHSSHPEDRGICHSRFFRFGAQTNDSEWNRAGLSTGGIRVHNSCIQKEEIRTNRDAPTGISGSISFQHPSKHAGGRTSNVAITAPTDFQTPNKRNMLQLKPLDQTVPIFQQLNTECSPVVLINLFQVAEEDIPALLDAWAADANWMKQQPGYISTQLHQGIAGSTTFMNYAVWESVAHFRDAFNHPDFKQALADYPSSAVASPHLFTRLTVPNLCVGP